MSLGSNSLKRVVQPFDAKGGVEYRLGFYYKASTPPPAGIVCTIYALDGDDNALKQVTAATDSDYHYFSVHFTPESDGSSVQLAVGCSFNVNFYFATFIFDDAAVYKVDGGCDLLAEPQDPVIPPVVPETPPGCASNMVGTPGFEHYDQSNMPWRGSNWGTQAQGPESDPNSRRAYSGEWLR